MKLDVMSQIKTAFTSLVSRAETDRAGSTGGLNGSSVRMADTATQPAHSTPLSERIKTAFNDFKKTVSDFIGRFTASRENNAPAPAASTKVENPEVTRLKNTLPMRLHEGTVSPQSLSTDERRACSYAFVKAAASKTDVAGTSTFMRTNDNGSALTSSVSKGSERDAIVGNLVNIIGDRSVMVTNRAFGMHVEKQGTQILGITYDPKMSPFPEMRDQTFGTPEWRSAKEAHIDRTLKVVEDCMVEAFGDPDDDASIGRAAAKLPQSLCDQIAILQHAVNDSSAKAEDKPMLRLHAARDAVVLRAINPGITDVNAASFKAGQEKLDQANAHLPRGERPIYQTDSAATSLLQLSKAVQSLVNGAGLGDKDTDPDLAEKGDAMKDRWDGGFAKFVQAALQRADQSVVAAAVRDGTQIGDEYRDAKNEIKKLTETA